MKVICISGKAQHGKTFTAEILKEMLEEQGHRVIKLAYGDYLKFVCQKHFGWDTQKNEKGRSILQKVGTDLARKNNPMVWVNTVVETILALSSEFEYFLIDDSRFKNEIDVFKERNIPSYSIRIHRNGFTSTLTDEQLKHPSETSLDDYLFDCYLTFFTGKDNVIDAINMSGVLEQITKEVYNG